MYYRGHLDGLPKTGVSGRQGLKITVLADFSTFWPKCPSMTTFENEKGMSPPPKVGSSFVEESNPKFSAPKPEIN